MVSSVSSSVLRNLQRESFRRLLQDALRLLGTFEQVADLFCRGDARSQFLAKQKREFVAEKNEAGIGNCDGKNIVLELQAARSCSGTSSPQEWCEKVPDRCAARANQ